MWSSNKDTNRSQYIPTHFKNFNPYDILEPEKVSHKKNEEVSTDVLIEIDDNTNKCDNSVDLTLHGSFLDRVKKSEYDLLDLYQNIYVTPHEIKKKDDLRNQNSSLNNIIKDSEIDFTELFEKAEHGQKLLEWKEYDINVSKAAKEISVSTLSMTNPTNFEQTHLNISRKEIPHPHVYKINPKNSNDTGVDLPLPSSIQKPTSSNNKILDSAISIKCAQLNLESDSETKFKEPEPICEDEIDEFLKPKLKDPSSLIKKLAPLASGKSLNDCCTSSSNNNGTHLLHTIENSTSLIIEHKLHVTSIHPTYTKSSITDLNSPPLYRLACQQESISLLHTVKLDPKAFKNKRIVKKDSEVVGFTKGPDLFEKSIVLPKIMERLAERKLMFDERKSVQRNLTLATVWKQNNNKVNINSAVAQSKSFETFLITNSLLKQNEPGKLAYQTRTDFCKHNKPTKLVANETVNGFSNKKPSKLSYQMTAGFIDDPIKEVVSQKVVSVCNRNENNKLVACQKVDALVEPKLSLKTPDLEPDKLAKLEPEVLMEDCNAKRIIALKTRVALEKFVKTGKLPP